MAQIGHRFKKIKRGHRWRGLDTDLIGFLTNDFIFLSF